MVWKTKDRSTPDSYKDIPLPILPRSGLKEPLRDCCCFPVPELAQSCFDSIKRHFPK